jgi:predicted CoA-binding protein
MSDACELPLTNATSAKVRLILTTGRTVAVVGLSDKPERESYRVAAYLQEQGFKIIPINPNVAEVLGEKAYANLLDVREPVDIVDIFRKPEFVPGLVEEAIVTHAKAVWMQKGIVHNTAAEKARQAGVKVVMNKCLMVEHQGLPLGPPAPAGARPSKLSR